MAAEVVEVTTESKEDVVINCVAILNEEGKEGEKFRNKFRCKVMSHPMQDIQDQ